MKRDFTIAILVVISFTLCCCSKNEPVDTENPSLLSGTIYYAHYDGFCKVDLSNPQKTVLHSTATHYNWFITADGNTLMEMTNGRSDDRPDHIKFSVKSLQTGELLHTFFYLPRRGGSIYQSADLSPDKSTICIFPSFDEGFVFLDAKTGEFLGEIDKINGESIGRYQNFAWLPDNSLLIKWKNTILRTKYPFNEVAVVRSFDTEDFGAMVSRHDGTKIAFNYANHIAVMNVDGSDFYMATSGEQIERNAVFSPDGTQLVVGTNFQTVPVPGSVPSGQSYMKVIPVDGRTYDPERESDLLLPIVLEGKPGTESTKGQMIWIK